MQRLVRSSVVLLGGAVIFLLCSRSARSPLKCAELQTASATAFFPAVWREKRNVREPRGVYSFARCSNGLCCRVEGLAVQRKLWHGRTLKDITGGELWTTLASAFQASLAAEQSVGTAQRVLRSAWASECSTLCTTQMRCGARITSQSRDSRAATGGELLQFLGPEERQHMMGRANHILTAST